MAERPPILCVDDEPHVLEGLKDMLRRHFDVTTETLPVQALQLLGQQQFAVIVSDMRMPEMDGAELLAGAATSAPDTSRVLLTGHADLTAAIRAVNEGRVFRFLTKPCHQDELVAVIEGAVEQHRLVTSEKVLLEQTLRGAVEALTEVLGLADPEAFGRAGRVTAYAAELAGMAGLPAWKLELAAMLLHVGYVALPPSVTAALATGAVMTEADQEALDRIPVIAEQLIAPIPRLEDVREILRAQSVPFGLSTSAQRQEAGILRVAVDFERLESQGIPGDEAVATLRGRRGRYDDMTVQRMAMICGGAGSGTIQEVTVGAIVPGMVFAEDVRTAEGTLLVPRGFAVTPLLLERLRRFPSERANGPYRMVVDGDAVDDARVA